MKKERKIVDYVTEEKTKTKSKDYSINKEGKIVNVPAIDKKGAKPRRIFAVILWLFAIACEVVAILSIKEVITLPKLAPLTWLIILIVLDLIFVICGSLLWKKANHIDPASEKNKTKFWLWNNLGTIVSVIAFAPLIVIIFTDKKMDKRTKTIAGVVAIIALLIGGLASYDWNPVSSEQLEAARAEILANGNYDTNDAGEPVVYWVQNSKKYHINKECSAINRSNSVGDIYRGTIDAAYQKGLTEPCRICIKAMEKINEEKEANSKIVSSNETGE